MVGDTKLASEILEAASAIPVECQERILDIMKAMAFTRRVVERERFAGGEARECEGKETA